ncbi:MAG: hypothetical protein NTW86_02950 [Candidatus Sumerlaeota bacterium]|nr:hypothetical protein [Candidatus Sumerlaeota bacterium]
MSETPPEAIDEGPFPIRGYLILNALVWALSLLMVLVIRWRVHDTTGVLFFALAIPIGFGVVSIFDAIYDRVNAPRN